jgi:hypothetical protein
VTCCACCISEGRKERSAEKCCSLVDAGSSRSIFPLQNEVNCNCFHSISRERIYPSIHSTLIRSSVYPFVFPSAHALIRSASHLSIIQPSIHCHFTPLSFESSFGHPSLLLPFICLSLDTSSCSLIQPSVRFHFIYPSVYAFSLHPTISPLPFNCVTHSASTLLFPYFIQPSFIFQSTFHLFSPLVNSPLRSVIPVV